MTRLIDADALKADLKQYFTEGVLDGISAKVAFNQILHDIDNAPTVEALTENDKALAYCEGYVRGSHEAYIRPQGEKIKKKPYGWVYCSECDSLLEPQDKFCWNCGAKMKGGAE